MSIISKTHDTNVTAGLKGPKIVINSETRLVNNTKLANLNLLLTSVNNNGEGKMRIDSLIKDCDDVHTWFVLKIDQPQVNEIRRLTEFDLEVLDAVTTLIISDGVRVFDSKLVTEKIFPGKRPTDKKVASTGQSIDRLMCTSIEIYCQKEFDARRDIPKGKYVYKGQILPLSKIEQNGKSMYVVLLLDNGLPLLPIYEYGRMLKQIRKIPYAWFATPSTYFQETEESICIRRRVILRIKQLLYKGIGPKNDQLALFWKDDREEGLIPALGYKIDREAGTWSGGPLDRNLSLTKKNWNRKKGKIQKVIEGTLKHLTDIKVIGGYTSYHKPGSKEVMGYVVKKGPMGRRKAS